MGFSGKLLPSSASKITTLGKKSKKKSTTIPGFENLIIDRS